MRCSSVKSSGVKISSGVRSSIRNAPPLISFFCSATADILILSSATKKHKIHIKKNSCFVFFVPFCGLIKSFENSCGAHATAHTHRHHSVSSVASLELAQDAGSQLRASAAERMAQRNCTAIDVDLIRIQSQRFDHSDRLRCKR